MKKRRRKPVVVESAGVHVRLFKRGAQFWLDVRDGDTRTRVSAKTTERAQAETNATQLAEVLARQKLLGLAPETLTLGQLLDAYSRHKGRTLEGQWKRAAESRRRLFLEAWGGSLPVAAISQTSVDEFCATRRLAYAAKRKTDTETTPPRVLRDGALDCDFRWLSSVFNWGMKHKLSTGKRLLSLNPLHDTKWPRERNVRRPVASHERYRRTSEQADAVDARGRLRTVLALARYTGRRESAIIQLKASDVMLSADRLELALAAAGMDERLAEHMPHGGIRWSNETDKQGVLHIAPISAELKAELERYLAANPRVGDVPLFPSVETDTEPMSRSLATKWLIRAERLAKLPKLVGGVWHPYRRLWATERQHLSDVSVAAGGGWKSTKTLKLYQGIDPASVLAAVVNQG